MKLTAIQLVLVAFVIFAITRVMLRLREKVLPPKAAFFWLIIWFSSLAIILLPTTTSRIASILGVGRGVDIIVYMSLATLFYLVFRIYVMIEDIRHETTHIVQQVALQHTNKKKVPKKRKK